MKRIVILIVLILALSQSTAISDVWLTYDYVFSPNGYCRGSYVYIQWGATLSGETLVTTATDGNGYSIGVNSISGFGTVGSSSRFYFGEAAGALNDVQSMPIILQIWETNAIPPESTLQEVYDFALASVLYDTIIVDASFDIAACADVANEPSSWETMSARPLNGSTGMVDVAVYNTNVPEVVGFDIYEIVGIEGVFAMTITNEMLEPWGIVPPETNTLIATTPSGLTEVWVLAGGGFQIVNRDEGGGQTDLFFDDFGDELDGSSH